MKLQAPSEAHSSAGFPTGHRRANSFADPAERLRTWHVLQRVCVAFGQGRIQDLDRLPLVHPFATGVPDPQLFRRLAADGCRLDKTEVWQGMTLLGYLRSFPALVEAVADYYHPVWDRLKVQPPPWEAMWERIATLAPRFDLRIRDEELDWVLDWSGFAPPHLEYWSDERTTTLLLDWSDFVSLDGLELLYALQLLAGETGRPAQVEYLKVVLRSAARALGRALAYHDEALKTWDAMTDSRLLCAASREPVTNRERAYQMYRHRVLLNSKASTTSPSQGRDRRLRRQREVDAIAWRFEERLATFAVHEDSDIYRWADANRKLLIAHMDYRQLLLHSPAQKPKKPPPLEMPGWLLQLQKRPRQSAQELRHCRNQLTFEFTEIGSRDPRSQPSQRAYVAYGGAWHQRA